MTKWADLDAVESNIADWTDSVISCRIYGHNWTASSVFRVGDGYTVTQKCSRCANGRTQDMDSRGFATSWTYSYSDGYLTKGLGRIGGDGRAALRLATLRNLTIPEPGE